MATMSCDLFLEHGDKLTVQVDHHARDDRHPKDYHVVHIKPNGSCFPGFTMFVDDLEHLAIIKSALETYIQARLDSEHVTILPTEFPVMFTGTPPEAGDEP